MAVATTRPTLISGICGANLFGATTLKAAALLLAGGVWLWLGPSPRAAASNIINAAAARSADNISGALSVELHMKMLRAAVFVFKQVAVEVA